MEEPAKVNYLQTVENLTFQNGKPVLDRSLLPNEKSVLDHLHLILLSHILVTHYRLSTPMLQTQMI